MDFSKAREIQFEKPEIIKPTFENYSALPYLGKNCDLKVIDVFDKSEERIEYFNNVFSIYLDKKKEIKPINKIISLYNDWLVSQATQIFNEKINKYSEIIDVKPSKIIVKNLKNRWGSITKNKTVNLNVNLIKAPEDIIDYIVIHELCHLKIKGHSYLFWDYLKQFMPDYEKKIKWLSRNSNSLMPRDS